MSGTSAGGQGAADAGQAGDAGEGGTQDGPDLGAIAEQLGSLTTGQEEMRSLLSAVQQAQTAPAEDGESDDGLDLDLSFLDEPGLDSSAIAERLTGQFSELSKAEWQAMAKPLQDSINSLTERVDESQTVREFDELVQEFPEIGEQETIDKLMPVAKTAAQQFGHPELASNAGFIRFVYMAARAADAASQEGNVPGLAHLEGASGAVPAGGGQAGLTADTIMGAHKGSSALPF